MARFVLTAFIALAAAGLAAEDFPDANPIPPLGSAVAGLDVVHPFGLTRGMNEGKAFYHLFPSYDPDIDGADEPSLDESFWPFTSVDFFSLPDHSLGGLFLSTDWIRKGDTLTARQVYMAVKTKLETELGVPTLDDVATILAEEGLYLTSRRQQTIWASVWKDSHGNVLAVESYVATGDTTGYINLEIWLPVQAGTGN
jgi:hypothetical protein